MRWKTVTFLSDGVMGLKKDKGSLSRYICTYKERSHQGNVALGTIAMFVMSTLSSVRGDDDPPFELILAVANNVLPLSTVIPFCCMIIYPIIGRVPVQLNRVAYPLTAPSIRKPAPALFSRLRLIPSSRSAVAYYGFALTTTLSCGYVALRIAGPCSSWVNRYTNWGTYQFLRHPFWSTCVTSPTDLGRHQHLVESESWQRYLLQKGKQLEL